MNRRFFFTNFYEDDFVTETDFYTAHTYLYLITCSHASLSGFFQLSKYKAMVESKILFVPQGESLFDTSLSILESAKKVFYHRNWFFVPKMAFFNSGLFKLETNRIAYVKEYNKVPTDIMGYFQEKIASNNITLYHSAIDSSIHSPIDIAMDTNKKKEIRNKNLGRGVGKPFSALSQRTSDYNPAIHDGIDLPANFTWDDLPKNPDGSINYSGMNDGQALTARILDVKHKHSQT